MSHYHVSTLEGLPFVAIQMILKEVIVRPFEAIVQDYDTLGIYST